MTVNELITKLDTMPADAEVWVSFDDDEITGEVSDVVLREEFVLLKAD